MGRDGKRPPYVWTSILTSYASPQSTPLLNRTEYVFACATNDLFAMEGNKTTGED